MNTSKILDIVPQATPAPAQPAPQPRTPPQAVPVVGDGAASDALRQHAQRQAEAEAAEADRKRSAPKAEPRPQSFNREVGFVDDGFQVFVDLVSPTLQSHRFRIFGPPDNQEAPPPPVETSDPAGALAAYAGSDAKPPVLKTDV
jgi:hypothetical protein